MIPAVLLLLGMLMLPESPRWLARKDRWEDCHAVLTLVHGKGDPSSPFVHREFEEIKEMCEFERRNADVSYLELFKPNMINRTHVGIFTQIWSQLTGMNVMMYYITYVQSFLSSCLCSAHSTTDVDCPVTSSLWPVCREIPFWSLPAFNT